MTDAVETLTRRLRRVYWIVAVVAIVAALATTASIYQRRRIVYLEERSERFTALCYTLGESMRDTRLGLDELTAPGHVPRFGEMPQAEVLGRIYQDLPLLYDCVPDDWHDISKCIGNRDCSGETLTDALAKLPTR
jgi:hypothetical protein